jgi:hypothetical protein
MICVAACAQTISAAGAALRYTGIVQCLRLVAQEEGVGALYRALPPRLISVVPMMGVQLAVYELCKRKLLARKALAASLAIEGPSDAPQDK